MGEALQAQYKNKVTTNKLIASSLAKKIKLIGWTRLLVFIGICFSGYYSFATQSIVLIVLFIIAILSFFFLLRLHQLLINKKEIITNLLLINENEIELLHYGKSIFDNGKEFLKNQTYCEDLDVFGEASLYHIINRTTTIPGKEKLAAILKNPFMDASTIVKQQEAVKEFAAKVELRQMIVAYGMRSQKEQPDVNQLLKWAITRDKIISSDLVRIIRFVFPVLFVLAVVFSIITTNMMLFVYAYLLNLLIAGKYLKHINRIHETVSTNLKSFSVFSDILKLINHEHFSSEILKESAAKTSAAAHQLKRLSVIGNFFDQRINIIIGALFNGIFLYDLQCAFMLEKWKNDNGAKLNTWISEIGNIEMLNSLATFAYNHPDFIYPAIMDKAPYLKAEKMGHPLIMKEKCIDNNIEIGNNKKLFLITGSNMSGKSTFLRTIGVNLLIAKCGMPVFASQFEFCPMEIYTSLRLSDSLQENVSLFFAELKKLKYILEQLQSNANAIVLLDEILKGTNSDDKHNGCRQLVKKLIQRNCITIMATHDIELTNLSKEHPEMIENYCFESNLSNNELSFDYKLKKGISQNRNATFLMQKMGIID